MLCAVLPQVRELLNEIAPRLLPSTPAPLRFSTPLTLYYKKKKRGHTQRKGERLDRRRDRIGYGCSWLTWWTRRPSRSAHQLNDFYLLLLFRVVKERNFRNCKRKKKDGFPHYWTVFSISSSGGSFASIVSSSSFSFIGCSCLGNNAAVFVPISTQSSTAATQFNDFASSPPSPPPPPSGSLLPSPLSDYITIIIRYSNNCFSLSLSRTNERTNERE